MSADDIKLPPMPDFSDSEDWEAAIHAWGIAAIQADRASRAEPVAWRIRHRPPPGMTGNYPWGYTEIPPGALDARYECEPLRVGHSPQGDAPARAVAGQLREPKNGGGWHVVWWNESMRMMLPDGARLDGYNGYRNGTMQLTVKVDAARSTPAKDAS